MDWKKLRKWSVMVPDKSHGMGCLQRARDWLRAVLCAICWLPEVWKTMCHIVVDFSIVFRLRSAEMKQCTCILSLWQHYLDSCMTDTPLCTLPSVCLYLTLGHQIKEDDMMPKRQKKVEYYHLGQEEEKEQWWCSEKLRDFQIEVLWAATQ